MRISSTAFASGALLVVLSAFRPFGTTTWDGIEGSYCGLEALFLWVLPMVYSIVFVFASSGDPRVFFAGAEVLLWLAMVVLILLFPFAFFLGGSKRLRSLTVVMSIVGCSALAAPFICGEGWENRPYRHDGYRALAGGLVLLSLAGVLRASEAHKKKCGEPGATDNPDDAERVREDH